MKRFALVAAIGLLAMACGGGGGAAGSSSGGGGLGNVKIGVLEPVSGANASSGQDTLHGIEVAADVLNGKLAVPGLPKLTVGKVQLVTQDTESNPQVGAAAVDQLVRTQKVAAMIGAYQSNVSLVAAQRADRLGGRSSTRPRRPPS
jgi:branched-chain amino acid transport system substrate-binding protein